MMIRRKRGIGKILSVILIGVGMTAFLRRSFQRIDELAPSPSNLMQVDKALNVQPTENWKLHGTIVHPSAMFLADSSREQSAGSTIYPSILFAAGDHYTSKIEKAIPPPAPNDDIISTLQIYGLIPSTSPAGSKDEFPSESPRATLADNLRRIELLDDRRTLSPFQWSPASNPSFQIDKSLAFTRMAAFK